MLTHKALKSYHTDFHISLVGVDEGSDGVAHCTIFFVVFVAIFGRGKRHWQTPLSKNEKLRALDNLPKCKISFICLLL